MFQHRIHNFKLLQEKHEIHELKIGAPVVDRKIDELFKLYKNVTASTTRLLKMEGGVTLEQYQINFDEVWIITVWAEVGEHFIHYR